MGGYGSGKRCNNRFKRITGDYSCIDIRRWKRKNLLTPGNSFSLFKADGISLYVDTAQNLNNFVIHYQSKKEIKTLKSLDYIIQLNWVNCHFGGKRPWFICPLKKCGQRVAILYGGPIFACRHCYKLVYQSQRESISDRAIRQAEKIRNKLQWSTGILDGIQDKPKGMHWCTFERLCMQHDLYADIFLAKISSSLA